MKSNPNYLHVDGNKILNGRGQALRLRGLCLGGWLNMENFMAGYPGHESGFRAAVSASLGQEKARLFFERYLHHFVGEDDLRFIKSLGCNVIRVALNYRHFEDDDRPFDYKPERFVWLDRLIRWARHLELYVILGLHAVQGWQSSGWHCDNPGGEPHFWGQKHFEDRAVALWEELARRYRQEAFVAGYNLMNEPEAYEVAWLNHFYQRVTAAIRVIDPDHILFLEGNHYSQRFEALEPPFDDNTVYSSHLYVPPGLDDSEYPGSVDGVAYDRDWLEGIYGERTAFMREHNVPHLLGEFGCIFNDHGLEPSRLRLMGDYLDITDRYADHWTIWNYKDIGKMGLICVDPESEWMRRTAPVRSLKTALRCDSWIERRSPGIDAHLHALADHIRSILGDRVAGLENLEESLGFAIGDRLVSRLLLPAFAGLFQGMDEAEIDRMMLSFSFQECLPREGLVRLLEERLVESGG